MVGRTVSHYRIVEELGGGGMGVVYKALDLRLNRFVALKFLSSALTKDSDANERFMQEARAASALDHPNICTIHEIDETPDRELFLTMAYYDGETLKQRLARGLFTIDEALDIGIQIAQGLARAHEAGIVHRDIKPANVMMAKDGLIKIVDFGLAKLSGHSDLTRTGTTLGTVSYMSPQQIRGGDVDAGTDVWSLGVVLYEMLAGCRPFTGKDDLATISNILDGRPRPLGELRPEIPGAAQAIVARALNKDVSGRYQSAAALEKDLTACRQAPTGTAKTVDVAGLLRRPAVALAAAAILIAIAVPSIVVIRRTWQANWARGQGIPQIVRLVAADKYAEAFAVAKEVDRYLPNDPIVAGLWDQFSAAGAIATSPADADVYAQPYGAAEENWELLGRTPLTGVRLPRGAFRLKVEKAGFETQLLATRNPGVLLGNALGVLSSGKPLEITLRPTGTAPEMVPVPGGAFPVGLTGFNSEQRIAIDPFLIDRYEVTNADFKRFVDRGGYANAGYWQELRGHGAIVQFTDSTGRPGPATWELGMYPSSQVNHPVAGVSWYEAVAYCRSEGKMLPTVFHWARAALSPVEIGTPLAPAIIPLSNFAGTGTAAVGTYRGMGPYGTYDMAGNVREWGWNESAGGRRWILGGTWSDPAYLFVVPNSLPPLDRSATNGFRCARSLTDAPIPDSLLARVETYARDHRTAKAVSNEVFDVFRRQYAYVKSELNDRIESKDEGEAGWVRERITFDAGYENGRVTAYLFLPKHAASPYQLVVFFPGVGPFVGRASSETLQPVDYVVQSGRALVYPVWKGSFERWDPFLSLQGEEYLRTFRTRMFQWRQELARVLDVLTMRTDIDATRVAYFGASFGASTAFPLIGLEDRLKVSVLAPAGFTYREMPPEADAINYVSHVTMPVLMLGGRHDYIFPLETAQKPMFERLGTPAEHKRHVVFDAGHANFPRSETIREVLAWLDRYLGPVNTAATSQMRPDPLAQ